MIIIEREDNGFDSLKDYMSNDFDAWWFIQRCFIHLIKKELIPCKLCTYHTITQVRAQVVILCGFRLWNFPSQYVKVHLNFMYISRCFQTCEFDWNLETYPKDIDFQSN